MGVEEVAGGRRVKVNPSVVIVSIKVPVLVVGKLIVLVPITTPPGPRIYVVPSADMVDEVPPKV